MGMAQELKDFTAGLQSGWKLMEDSEYKRALAKYYAGRGKSAAHYGYGGDDDKGGLFGGLFGGGGEKLTDFERGSKNLVTARQRAFAAGDVNAVEKLDKDIVKYNAMKPADPEDDDDEEEVETNAFGGLAGAGLRQAVNVEPAPAKEEAGADDEDAASTMSKLAMPGVDAGLRSLQSKLQPTGAVEDPRAEEDKLRAFANNDGAAPQDVVAALNKIVDPDGVLPKDALSSARIAAVYEFYDKKGEPDKGAAAANSLLLHDKANSQTRGALAMEAVQQGDYKSAAKLIADAYNYDLPGDMRIEPAVADDGSITAKIIKGGVTQEEITATPTQLAAMAKEVSTGKAYTDQLTRLAAEAKARTAAEKKAKTGSKASAPTQAVDTTDLEGKLTALKRQYAAAETQEEKDRIEDQARKVYNEIRTAAAAGMKKGKSPEWALGQRGVTPLSPSAAAGNSKSNEPTTDDMTASVDRRAALDAMAGVNADTREALPVAPNGVRTEGGTVARATRQAVDSLTTGNLGARKADIRAENTKDADVKGDKRDEVYKLVEGAVEESEDITKRAKGRELSTLQNVGVVLAQKNNLTSNQVKNLLEQAVDPTTPIRFDGKGRVQIGSNRPVVVDGTTARQLMGVQKSMTARLKPMPEAQRAKAIDIINRGGDREAMRKYLIDNGFSPEGL